VTASSATAKSRSQFDPGKTTTALRVIARSDNRVCEQLLTHRIDVGVAGCARYIEFDRFALANIVDAGEPQSFEGVMNSLALWVEDAGFESDDNTDLHGAEPMNAHAYPGKSSSINERIRFRFRRPRMVP